MITKLEVWSKCLSCGKPDFFPSFHDFVIKSGEDLNAEDLQTVKEYLKCLKRGLHRYLLAQDNSLSG
jgi:hypothetical protein